MFDFREYHSCFLTATLFSASSYLVCSIHRYVMTRSLRNSGQWLFLSGNGSNSYICACVCIFVCMGGYSWSGHICTTCTHCMCFFCFFFVCIFKLLFWRHSKHSRGSENFFRIQDGAGRRDGFLTAGPASGPCKPVTSILTQVCVRYLCICTPVCMHACVLHVCVSWWAKHLSRTSRDKKANYHEAGHCRDAHSYFPFKLAHWIWV